MIRNITVLPRNQSRNTSDKIWAGNKDNRDYNKSDNVIFNHLSRFFFVLVLCRNTEEYAHHDAPNACGRQKHPPHIRLVLFKQILHIRRYLFVLFAHILLGNRSAIRADVSTDVFSVHNGRFREFKVMPRSRDFRIVFIAALSAMENSFSLRFTMRFSYDACSIIVTCRFYRIGQIFVSANGTGMQLSAVLRTGRFLCRFGIFVTERRPNVRFVSISTIQTGVLDTTVSRTGRFYRFDIVIMPYIIF